MRTELDRSLEQARILIVDDEEGNVDLLKRVLGVGGYEHVRSTTDPREVRALFSEFRPDLILLDLFMPHLDGFGVLAQLQLAVPPNSYLPVLVLTADITPDAKRRALSEGAKDFITKPFDVDDVLLRVKNMLATRLLHQQLLDQNESLEERVRTRTRELELAHEETLERLALAAEYRDDDTGLHIKRVGRTAGLLAAQLGLSDKEAEVVRQAASLHDVGKIGIPDAILLAPRSLTPQEFAVVKTHTEIGSLILSGSDSQLMRAAERVARTHHERWDGTGYGGLAGTQIPLEGRITAVADAFDAMTNFRPYRAVLSLEKAVDEIRDGRGGQFDPDIVDAFLKILDQLVASVERGAT
jgi:putative two-component system response regulator